MHKLWKPWVIVHKCTFTYTDCQKKRYLLPGSVALIKRHLKKGIQEFHRRFVSAPADKAANNVVVVWKGYYINTLK